MLKTCSNPKKSFFESSKMLKNISGHPGIKISINESKRQQGVRYL